MPASIQNWRARSALSRYKTRTSRQNLPPKEVRAGVLMGRRTAAYTIGGHLAALGNALWTSAQKNIKETSGCRFLSSRHCGKLSGSLFGITTWRKRNGRSTPSFSSKEHSRKAAASPGFECSGRSSDGSSSNRAGTRNCLQIKEIEHDDASCFSASARTFALPHRTSAIIAGATGNGHSVPAPAPPKETQ